MSYCIYLRKSRIDRDYDEGSDTLLRHERMLTEFAQKGGFNVTRIYREIVSGESIANRPVLQELLHDVERCMWDGVIVADIERLARGDTCDQGVIINTFKFTGTKIITPNKVYNAADEFDEGFFEFSLFMSRQEYKVIKRRLQRGKYSSVKEGKFVSSVAPYGYERVKIKGEKGYTLKPNQNEAETVKMIFSYFVKQRESGMRISEAITSICNTLNKSGIPTRSGNPWKPPTIREFLQNPVYIGKIRWNARPRQTKIINGEKVSVRPRGHSAEIYEGLHEGIIHNEIFEKAQLYIKKH
ncbi:MAG: recombinase family protein [Lachnospiraceae bacterium]|nr:recombinase family protein [Lachnospiraceae bacterium]